MTAQCLTVQIPAWRCKRCGYCWPVRGRQTGERPRKCPGCDSPLWWRDYSEPLDGPHRAGRRRRPYMLAKTRGEVPRLTRGEPEAPEAPEAPPLTLGEILARGRLGAHEQEDEEDEDGDVWPRVWPLGWS